MKKAILYSALCLSGTALAQDTTYFKQDFEDLTLSIWADHYDKTITTETQALPHVKFNDLRGGLGGVGRRVNLETASGDRVLKVKVEKDQHYGRSISYYLGGRIVRGDPAVHKTHKGGKIYDSYVPDNDEMYFRYHIKLGSDWGFRGVNVVKIPGLAGTYNSGSGGMWPQDPDSLGWSARMLAGRGPDLIDDPWPENEWVPLSYVYHLEQRCGNPPVHHCGTGDHFPYDDGVLWRHEKLPRHQIGQWYRFEQRIKMNSPPDSSNGLTEVWIDGKKIPPLCDYQLRFTTADTIGINRAWADIHYGGQYSSPKDHHLFLDDFHVSTGPTPWSGELVGHSEWSGTILVTGDVTIPDGMDLTIAADTEIRFAANSDETGGGEDPARSELIVRGNLTTVGGGITFRSSNTTDPSHDDWYGIRVKSLGVARLTDVTVRDAVHCEQAGTGGLLFSSGVTLLNCGQVPLAPGNLKAAPRDQAVLLTWDTPAANNGSPLTGYEYRQSTDGGATWSPDWGTIPLPSGTTAADLTEHTVTSLTNGTVYTFEVRAVNEVGEGAAAQVTLPPENLRARWVFGGLHLLANNKAQLTWDDPDDDRITGWDYRQKAGAAAWEDWEGITGSGATTVTHSVEGVEIWRTYRFQVRARYGTHTGAEPEVVLFPLPVLTQAPVVVPRSGDGKAQFEVGFDLPVDVDLPDGDVPNEYFQIEVTETTAAGVTTSEWVALLQSEIERILPGATLEAEFTDTDLPPIEGLVTGGTGAADQTASRQVLAYIRVSGLDPEATYQFKVRLVPSDGVTELEPASGSVLGLRWQRPTATAVALSWTDPNKPFIRTWQYRQRAGSGSWERWQNVRDPGATTTTHLVSGLEAEETYEFQVRALVPGGPLAESFTVSAPPQPLVAPGNLHAVPGHASMTLRWDDPNNARITGWQYRQRQAREDWGGWQRIPGSTASTTSYTVPGLTNGVSYRFRVRALAGSQEGPFGKSVGGPPNGLRAQALNGAVELVWADPSDSRIAGWQYRVREGQDRWSGWQPVPGSTASTTSYTVTDLTNGVNHRFRVRGVASNGGEVLTWPMVETSPDASLAVPPPAPATNGPPEITSGPSAVSFDENVDGVVATYTGTDPDSDALTWTLGGADVDTMEIDASGRLSFREPPPDFEDPGDTNGDKIYEVTVTWRQVASSS